jgi:hypothetical protein
MATEWSRLEARDCSHREALEAPRERVTPHAKWRGVGALRGVSKRRRRAERSAMFVLCVIPSAYGATVGLAGCGTQARDGANADGGIGADSSDLSDSSHGLPNGSDAAPDGTPSGADGDAGHGCGIPTETPDASASPTQFPTLQSDGHTVGLYSQKVLPWLSCIRAASAGGTECPYTTWGADGTDGTVLNGDYSYVAHEQDDPTGWVHQASNVKASQSLSDAARAHGLVPEFTLQGGPGDYVSTSTNAGAVAFRAFYSGHPSYDAKGPDGTDYPSAADYGGTRPWGQISWWTPMLAADCQSFTHGSLAMPCTYGQAVAANVGWTGSQTHTEGVELSDYVDGLVVPANGGDFSDASLAAYAAFIGVDSIPGSTTRERASWIRQNQYSRWLDFVSAGLGTFTHDLSDALTTRTGKPSLVTHQCAFTPGMARNMGVGMHEIVQYGDIGECPIRC